jgi:hypothetical protein
VVEIQTGVEMVKQLRGILVGFDPVATGNIKEDKNHNRHQVLKRRMNISSMEII